MESERSGADAMTRPIADMRWIADNSDEMSQVNDWALYHFRGSWARSVVVSVNRLRKLMEACIREGDNDLFGVVREQYEIDIDMDAIYYVDDFKHLLRMIGRDIDDRD